MKEQINKFGKYLFWLIPIFGIVLRLVVYFQNRSVFLDEANVCLNIIEKTYPDFFFPLDYDQMVPPLWSIVVKTFQIILGNSEFSFRLFPLICSIFSIYLFWEISNKILQHKISILFINWIFATNIFLLKYATEAKQYGSDVTVTLLLILFALHEKDFNSNSSFFKWLCIGSISIWFSMPSVFILFGVGSYFLFQYSKKKKRIVFPKTLYASFVWILLFGIYYYTLLRHNIQNDYLQNYHQNYFLPIIPSSLSSLQQWLSIQEEILRHTIGVTTISIIGGTVFLLLGIFRLIKKEKGTAIIFMLPILACWFASGIEKYSLLPRLALFYAPIIMLIMAFGIDLMWSFKNKISRGILLVFILLFASHQWGYQHLYKPLQYEELKPVLISLKEKIKPKQELYIHSQGVSQYKYYTEFHPDKDEIYKFNNKTSFSSWGDIPPTFEKGTEIWLIFSHTSEKNRVQILNHFKENGELLQEIKDKRAAAYLYEIQ